MKRIFALIALLIYSASMLSCAAERPAEPVQHGSVAPVAVTEPASKKVEKQTNTKAKSQKKTKATSATPPFTAPTIKDFTAEPDPATLSEDSLSLREYAEKMLELHPFYNEANREYALKNVLAFIPSDLDYMEIVDAKLTSYSIFGVHTCPSCCQTDMKVKVSHAEPDGGTVDEMSDSFIARSGYWYPDRGDTATATCDNCGKSFDVMNFCLACKSIGTVKTACLGDTDPYGEYTLSTVSGMKFKDLGITVWGWCENCDASFRYQNCFHECGEDCPYESHTFDEAKERIRAAIQKQWELDIARQIFSSNYFVTRRY